MDEGSESTADIGYGPITLGSGRIVMGERIEYHSLTAPPVIFSVVKTGNVMVPEFTIYRNGVPTEVTSDTLYDAIIAARMAADAETRKQNG